VLFLGFFRLEAHDSDNRVQGHNVRRRGGPLVAKETLLDAQHDRIVIDPIDPRLQYSSPSARSFSIGRREL
jgi:hypothetical protein